MAKPSSALRHGLIELSESIRQSLSRVHYNPPEASPNVSVKSMLQSLLPQIVSQSSSNASGEAEIRQQVRDFSLCCAALASSSGATCDELSWIPNWLSFAAESAFRCLSKDVSGSLRKIGELGSDLGFIEDEKVLAFELMHQVLPLLKDSIKESSIDKSGDGDEISAAIARSPVAYAIVSAYQFRWFVTQIESPHLGKVCSLVIPCALTCLDHWSPEVKESGYVTAPISFLNAFGVVVNLWETLREFPEVKGQGMISFIHLGKNVNAGELSFFQDVILDACCQNIASADEIWHLVVEMSVVLLTSIHQNNPRSSWFEKIFGEMLSHLERQPRNKDRRLAWLKNIDRTLNAMGLVLLAHFRRIFPLFFQWMHSDDDETVLLVLERVHTVLKLTWIRNSPYVDRLVDELTTLYKEAAMKISRQEIRALILQILTLLDRCKRPQLEAAWEKHKDDPNLTALSPSSFRGGQNITAVAP